MENEEFLKKYFAEEDREKQLSLLKKYMLSLSPEDLKKFILRPMDLLEKALESSEVDDERKKKILHKIDEMIFFLKGKVSV